MADSPATSHPVRRTRARQARVLGAGGIATVSTLVAAVAHATAGGGWPNAVTLVAALVLSVFVTLPVVGARVRSWRIAAAVAVDQAVFHALFSTIGTATALGPASGGAHAHHADLPVALLLGSSTATTGLGMGIHHLFAGAVTFALLRGGWQLVLRAVRRGAEHLLRTPADSPVLSGGTRPAPSVTASPRIPTSAVLRHTVNRRGPPVPAALG